MAFIFCSTCSTSMLSPVMLCVRAHKQETREKEKKEQSISRGPKRERERERGEYVGSLQKGKVSETAAQTERQGAWKVLLSALLTSRSSL